MKNKLLVTLALMPAFALLFSPVTAQPAEAKAKRKASSSSVQKNSSIASQAMRSVHQSYTQGRYRDALDKIAAMPPSDMTHYYAGLCYQGQGQLRSAASEFQWVASYSKNPGLQANASAALNSVSRYAARRTYTGNGNNYSRVASAHHSAPVRRRG
ncbi:MAG: hypothetical protein KC777_17810 [Cyanobacteria bacterium HKST-UBA02]|nr:hypothetical protein [Cyanobacteria bacterium HKST-UBA02]